MKPENRAAMSLLIVLAVIVCATTAPAAQSPNSAPKSRADACLDKAAEMTNQGKLSEAADNYLCAADETAKIPGQQKRAARFRAQAHFYRSRSIYTQRGVTGTMGRANLDEALRQVALSLPLWDEAKFPDGTQLAEGWQLYLQGIRSGQDGRYGEARERFEKARSSFMELDSRVPPLHDMTQALIDLAEDQTIFASLMDLLANRGEYTKHGGDVNRRLADLKERASPPLRPYYDALGRLFEATRLFDEAGNRLDAWDHETALRRLDEARTALQASGEGPRAVPSETRRAQLAATIGGWSDAVEAEAHHARALHALLDQGDPGRARVELIEGAERYRKALLEFEHAALGPGATGSVEAASARLNERAKVMAAAFGVGDAMLGAGRVFFLLFFVALALLTWPKPRLRLNPRTLVWIALVVALIGAFGLRAPDLLNAVKQLPAMNVGRGPG